MGEKLVKDLMEKKVISVTKDTTIKDLSRILLKYNITGVPVVNNENKLIGMVTDADIITENLNPIFPIYFDPLIMSYAYLDSFEQHQKDIKDFLFKKVEEVMTHRVKTVKADTPISDAVRIFIKERVNRIPVIDENGKVIGIIARADILKSMLGDLEENELS